MIYAGIITLTFLLFAAINFFAKNKKPFKRAFINMLLGVLSLIAVNIAGLFWNVGVGVSPLSLTISATLGVPGVAVMVIVKTLL